MGATSGDPDAVTSGRSVDDEFQRTVGALFAVYWLMRLDLDGARAFSFGVGDDWKTLSISVARPIRAAEELKKRNSFLVSTKWSLFENVLADAGLLHKSAQHEGGA